MNYLNETVNTLIYFQLEKEIFSSTLNFLYFQCYIKNNSIFNLINKKAIDSSNKTINILINEFIRKVTKNKYSCIYNVIVDEADP